jgi:hypothetical protein
LTKTLPHLRFNLFRERAKISDFAGTTQKLQDLERAIAPRISTSTTFMGQAFQAILPLMTASRLSDPGSNEVIFGVAVGGAGGVMLAVSSLVREIFSCCFWKDRRDLSRSRSAIRLPTLIC